jgi:hypothetical protein
LEEKSINLLTSYVINNLFYFWRNFPQCIDSYSASYTLNPHRVHKGLYIASCIPSQHTACCTFHHTSYSSPAYTFTTASPEDTTECDMPIL